MDPHRVLGLEPGASPGEVAAAYRRLAKQWHPDVAGRPEAVLRMAEINAAYEALRRDADDLAATASAPNRRRPRRTVPGAWLPPSTRRALGRELLGALHQAEDVVLVTPAAMWDSPRARLAATDRRLLWLLEDAVGDRVRWVRLREVAEIEHRLAWPRRRTATVRVRLESGRRLSFAELQPATAAALVRHVERARAAA